VLAAAGFESTTARVNSSRPAGAFVGTSPGRGGRAVPGQVVTILVSNGSGYVEPVPQPEVPPPPVEPPPVEPPPVEPPPVEPPPVEPPLPGG
jgi:beta-lactam-binding protein with PASTA domain